VPESLAGINLEIVVAGRRFYQSFPAEPNQSTVFTWDRKDGYGRVVQGQQTAKARLGYAYRVVYYPALAEVQRSFAQFAPSPDNVLSRATSSFFTEQKWETKIGSYEPEGTGLGGWSLSIHHGYDPQSRTLYLENGQRRGATGVNAVITTVAGSGTATDDGGPATEAALSLPTDVVVGPDDSPYIVESSAHAVRKVDPDGIITTIAGRRSVRGFSGDGGPVW
jgi:hypothetical protein